MSKRPDSALDPAGLRLRAERLARVVGPAARADSDTRKQWHELQVSQIELEIQQAALSELQQQRDAAEAGLNRFAELYDQAPAGYLSLDPDGRISRVNLAAAALLGGGRAALLGRGFEQFLAPEYQPEWRRFLAGLYADGARSVLEVALYSRAAGDAMVRIEANLDPVGRKCRMIVTDMGDSSAREAARRRAFQVLDSIDEGVLVCDAQRRIVAVNPAFTRITGYLAEEALGRDPGFLGRAGAHPPGYRAEAVRQSLAQGRWLGEMHNVRRDGSPFLCSMSLTVVRAADGGVDYFTGVFSDITERKRAEQVMLELSRELDARVVERTAALTAANLRLRREVAERKRAEQALHRSREQLRKLADHLATVKENERKRIAREIHDELGQNLLALRLDISMLRNRAGARHPRLVQRVDAVLGNVDSTIRSVRGIMNELRPPVLDLGLQAAIEWQIGEFRKRTGLACRLVLEPDDSIFAVLKGEVEIVLFRSLQESLTNVMRHSGASDVEIRLRANGARLELRIADNGVGIAPQHRAKNASFGLIGIGERVGALGGRFEIEPYLAGRGCMLLITFDLPLPEPGQTVDGAARLDLTN